MNLEAYLVERARWVEEALAAYLPVLPEPARQLGEAMRYSLFAGGKRLRPVLALAGAEALGRDPKVALPAACALEFIHTYSLIHDDLPAMDDDDWRRGKPTNHKVFGEAQAILAGDGLLTQAFAILATAEYPAEVAPEKVLAAIAEIAAAAGPEGMVGGQSADIRAQGKSDADGEFLHYIHTHKTGALLRASVRVGALLAGAAPAELAALTAYGEKLGLAFQISDDILDATGDPKVLGKPVKNDAQKQKLTYVTLYGLAKARQEARRLAAEAEAALGAFGPGAEPLRQLARFTVERNH
ncbi:polyprenyl synthetase family protein [Gelria sp. Kuro-4]|uniref:polyprenyl synthetase family protein n=1 Tax=Gelria sp. Kuro-4 TaxID=2796927 RepID=UPI001BEE427F|nr:farnesyl diphosphate synthase [Gelria sp. Kuro-4]BCV25117.1 farnesyl-diphosphate synthase [Gelria sp. Kuro-4]